MKQVRNLIFVFTLALGAIFIVGCQTVSAESYVAIDINPSVELIVNRRDVVVAVNPLNEDAEVLLTDLELVGLKLEVATTLIVEKAIELGYIDVDSEETVVSVTTIGYNDRVGNRLGEQIRSHINNMFMKKGIFGYAMISETMQEIKVEADELGVSPGKLRLVKVVQVLYPELTTEEGLEMSISELMTMVKEKQQEVKDIVAALREEFLTRMQEIKDEYIPLIEALETEIEALAASIADETDQEVKATLEAELAVKQEAFATLRLDFRFEMDQLREEFKERSLPIREQVRTQHQERINQFRQQMEEFRNSRQPNERIMNQIRSWQQNRIGANK